MKKTYLLVLFFIFFLSCDKIKNNTQEKNVLFFSKENNHVGPEVPNDPEPNDDGFVLLHCGDGRVTPPEECDIIKGATDGTEILPNIKCNQFCRRPSCGNCVKDGDAEECDDCNDDDGDNCNSLCQLIYCGNLFLETKKGEECDDGNNTPGDGCSPTCLYEVCGNGIIDPKEVCDDGNRTPGDGCSSYCQIESCGNNIVTPPEECDDGNRQSGDGCSAQCKLEGCP